MAVTKDGTIYFADSSANAIFQLTKEGTLRLVAGNGDPGYSGDNGAATSARLQSPTGVAVDTVGNLYIADFGNHRIRKVTPEGTITTVAGNGTEGFAGDQGPGIAAALSLPTEVAVDGGGNLFFVDSGNERIRKVTPAGTISTVAGSGTAGFSGDGGPATSAQLQRPSGLVADASGNLIVADGTNFRIRKVATDGIITTVAGNGTDGSSGDNGPATSAQLSYPRDLALDSAGNLYVADSLNHRVRKIDPNGIITTVAGSATAGYTGDNGPATAAQLERPDGLAVDYSGTLYLADSLNFVVRKVTPAGTITTVAGNGTAGSGDGGPATQAQLGMPFDVAIDASGNVFVSDAIDHIVRKISGTGTITTVAGTGKPGYSGDGSPATEAQLNYPTDLALDSAGSLYVVDSGNQRIRKVAPNGTITTVAGNGLPGFSGDGGPAANASLNMPSDIVVDRSSNLYVVDYLNRRVRKVSPDGTITTVAGNGTDGIAGDGWPAVNAQLSNPSGLALDAQGNLYVTDAGDPSRAMGPRIRRVDAQGTIATVAANDIAHAHDSIESPRLYVPHSLAVDSFGALYVTDLISSRIVKVSNGTMTVIAGTGIPGYSGDDGPSLQAQLNNPLGIAISVSGDLIVADSFNRRVRKLSRSQPLSETR